MAKMNLKKQIEKSMKSVPTNDYLLGRGLNEPFSAANSGSRKLMHSVHYEHLMVLRKGEVPLIQTGFEDEFGRKSTSYIESESNYRVVDKISKFDFKPNLNYYLIIQDLQTGEYDYIHRTEYKHNTQSYGYLYDNKYLDSLVVGSSINKGDVLNTSNGYDEFYNKTNGVNLTTVYIACDQNMEDSVIISETCAKKLESTLVKQTDTAINDNDILLNLYGEGDNYKTFPDIGEPIKDGIFCGIRRLENETALFTLSRSRLKELMISDKVITLDGIVADINIRCNNVQALSESHYNQQVYFYYNEYNNFCKKINETIGSLVMAGNKLSYKLEKLYGRCRDALGGVQWYKERPFNNIIMEITVIEPLACCTGDKLCDRYGGKGVISEIRPDNLMPMLDNGTVIDIIKNQSTCINRENLGQLNEQSLTFIGSRLLDTWRTGAFTYVDMYNMWHEFVSFLNPSQTKFLDDVGGLKDEFEAKMFIDSILSEDDGIILSLLPFTNGITIDTLNELYKKFPWIKPYKVTVPIKDSNGNIRRVQTRRTLVVGKIYHYRLKQFAEEKFSVTSLSATNLKNLNTKSKSNKIFESRFAKTPIQFGPMESGDLAHLGMENVVTNLMLYSSSPQGRRLFQQLLTGDPYNIDIKLDITSKNRNAEIINAISKAMGWRIVFDKKPKQKKQLVKKVMCKPVSNIGYKYKTNIRDIIGHDDELDIKYRNAKLLRDGKKIANKIMAKRIDKKE